MSEEKHKSERVSERVWVHLTPQVADALDRLANRQGMSRSCLVRGLCLDLIRREMSEASQEAIR